MLSTESFFEFVMVFWSFHNTGAGEIIFVPGAQRQNQNFVLIFCTLVLNVKLHF